MVDLTRDFEEKLKAHIAKIEGKFPLEIVPVLVKRASDYKAWSLLLGLLLSYVPARLLSQHFLLWHSYSLFVELLIWLITGYLFSLVLSKLRLFSFFVPKAYLQEKALRKAESIFLHEGVFETKQRLGVLISVFEYEKTVIVLADKGFNAHIPQKYWSDLGATLASDFNHKKAGDEFFQALEKIEQDIAHKFNHDGENLNELCDELRKK